MTKPSIEQGNDNANAPLRFSDDEKVLTEAALFPGRGLIADGVTPVLLRLEIAPDKIDHYPNEATLRLEAKMVSGALEGPPIQDRLEVFEDGHWKVNGRARVSKDKPVAHAMFNAILADQVNLAAGKVEVVLKIDVRDHTDLIVGTIRIPIRRPPIVLLHGYNTEGDWDPAFLKAAQRFNSRRD